MCRRHCSIPIEMWVYIEHAPGLAACSGCLRPMRHAEHLCARRCPWLPLCPQCITTCDAYDFDAPVAIASPRCTQLALCTTACSSAAVHWLCWVGKCFLHDIQICLKNWLLAALGQLCFPDLAACTHHVAWLWPATTTQTSLPLAGGGQSNGPCLRWLVSSCSFGWALSALHRHQCTSFPVPQLALGDAAAAQLRTPCMVFVQAGVAA